MITIQASPLIIPAIRTFIGSRNFISTVIAPAGTAIRVTPSALGCNESVAPLAVFLLSEAAGNLNGQVFGVRGGDIYLYSNPAIDRQIVSYGRRFTMDEMDDLMPRTLALDIPRPVTA